MDTKKIIEKAQESYKRYFKDAPQLPEKHGEDIVYDVEQMQKVIDAKKKQLDGHVDNLNAIKKEIEDTATESLSETFPNDSAEYAKNAVNQMLADYDEEKKRIEDLKKKIEEIKK